MPPQSEQSSVAWITYALMTVAAWGVYGIFLHTGQTEMKDPALGRYKAFLFVGIAYFLTAVLAPLVLLWMKGADWSFTAAGSWWSLLAGIVGAIGAFSVLLAFGAGGKPPVVMTIVFAGAPIVNAVVGSDQGSAQGRLGRDRLAVLPGHRAGDRRRGPGDPVQACPGAARTAVPPHSSSRPRRTHDRRPLSQSRGDCRATSCRAPQAPASRGRRQSRFTPRGCNKRAWQANSAGLDDFFRNMPFTRKEEIAADQQAHPPYGTNLTYPLAAYNRFTQTSATSGAPLRWLDTPESWQWMLDNWKQVLAAAEITPRRRPVLRLLLRAVPRLLDGFRSGLPDGLPLPAGRRTE